MFTSEKNKKTLLKVIIAYACITIFIVVFGLVYERFSHDVYSFWMAFAWIWVLIFGLVPNLIYLLIPIKKMPGILSGSFYNLGVALFTSGSIYKGVVDIYGTTREEMFRTYLIISVLFLAIGFGLYIFGVSMGELINKEKETESSL